MASYTDSPQVYLPQGSPMVDPNLYDAALQYKQAQYNQGVQRIQGSYDSVAGLDVIRGVDKEYLQSKLGDLTSQLNQMAGGDFSNQSLVAQAASLAPSIARDPRVQNAVVSTQGVRNLISSGKALKRTNPELYPAQAEDYDNTQVSNYINNQDTDATYDGPRDATRYYDCNKPLREFLHDKDPTIETIPLPGGKYTYRTVKTSKITAEDLTNLINGFFDSNPQYQKSAMIDGQYTYKGLDNYGLYSKAVGTMQTQLDRYAGKQKDLIDKAKMYQHDPAAMEQIEKEGVSTVNMMNGLKENIGKYKNLFSTGTPLSAIKTELQMDQIRNTYVNLYEKNDKETEIKGNEEAINSMRFQLDAERIGIEAHNSSREDIKAGIDPDTRQTMLPTSKWYPLFMAANPAYAKLTSTKLNDPNAQKVTVTPVGDKGNVDIYSDTGLDSKIKDFDDQIVNRENDLKLAFIQGHPDVGFDHAKNTFLKPEDEKSFKDWEAQQELYIQAPQLQFEFNSTTGKNELTHKIDQNYLDFRQDKQMIMANKQNLMDIKNNVGRDAEGKFDISNIKDIIKVPVSGGHVQIPIGLNPGFVNEAFKIENEANANSYNEMSAVGGGTNMGTSQPFGSFKGGALSPKEALDEAIEKRKNQPGYAYFKQIVQGGAWGNLIAQLNGSVGENEKNKNDWKSTQYKAMASRINPQGTTIIDKDDYAEYRGYIGSALQNNPSGAQGVDLEKVIPHTVYTGADGLPHVQYSDNKGQTGDVAVPVKNNLIGRPSPDEQLNNIIQNSYQKSTPMKGTNVFSTPNGKIKYAIGLNPLDKTSYRLYILDGQKVIPIDNSSNGGKYNASGEAKRQIEALSTAVNPKTGAQLTMEEIIQMTKNAKK